MRLLLTCLTALMLLSACNTMQGFGRDVEHLGNKIDEKASR